MNVLFVCSRNRRRSPTAEVIFHGRDGLACSSAGTATDAETSVSTDLLEWADLIVAMESIHRRRLRQQFSAALKDKRIVVLDIPDRYDYMDDTLVEVLRTRMATHIRQHHPSAAG